MRFSLLAAASALALGGCQTMAAPPDGVSAEAMAIHQRLMTLDTHLDTPALLDGPRGYDITKRHSVDREGSQVDLPRMKDGGLDGGFWAIYMPQGPLDAGELCAHPRRRRWAAGCRSTRWWRPIRTSSRSR